MRFLLLLLIPALSFAQNGLVTIKLKGGSTGVSGWGLNGSSIVDSNFIGTTNSKDLVFKTKNTEAMRIDTNGNVGIGTATPTTKLDIRGAFYNSFWEGDVQYEFANLIYGGVSITNYDSVTNNSVGFTINNNDIGFSSLLGSGGISVNIKNDFFVVKNPTTGYNTIIADSFGNVGIGLSVSPTAKLHVNGTTRLEGTPQSTTSDSLLTIDGQGNVAWRTPYYYGTDTLTNGVDTVWTSDVTANSNIQLTSNGLNGSTQSGDLDVTIISAGNYFVVNSLKSNTTVETGDQRKYYWFFIRKP